MLKSKRTPILKPPAHQKTYEIIINSEQCDGCEICVNFCPKELIEVDEINFNSRMIHYIKVMHPENCTGCKQCERLCPTASLFVKENEISPEVACNES